MYNWQTPKLGYHANVERSRDYDKFALKLSTVSLGTGDRSPKCGVKGTLVSIISKVSHIVMTLCICACDIVISGA